MADDSHVIKWHVDAAFTVYDDFKSHTVPRVTTTLGSGSVTTGSNKQQVSNRSTTEAELFGLDNFIAKGMWTANRLN
jgi:hypothetical protein